MEYHQDRFTDFSLMLYQQDQLIAILPANNNQSHLVSHEGLTYGGLIFGDDVNPKDQYAAFGEVLLYLNSVHMTSLTLKLMPDFYLTGTTNSYSYLEQQQNKVVVKENIVMAIDYSSNFKIHKTKLKRYRKLNPKSFSIKEGTAEFDKFWNTVLISRLRQKHNTDPVHSLSEIKLLRTTFKSHIFQYNIYKQDEILAGITILKKGHIIKSQYGIATANGEKCYALDMLFVYLIKKFQNENMHYFSMGTVSNNSDLGYSEGMLKQKEEFGCQQYLQKIIKIQLND